MESSDEGVGSRAKRGVDRLPRGWFWEPRQPGGEQDGGLTTSFAASGIRSAGVPSGPPESEAGAHVRAPAVDGGEDTVHHWARVYAAGGPQPWRERANVLASWPATSSGSQRGS